MSDLVQQASNNSGDPGAEPPVKRRGRPLGSRNKRTAQIERAMRPLLPGARKRLQGLIQSNDEKVALQAVTTILHYVFGRPIDRRELTGGEGGPVATAERTPLEAGLSVLAALGMPVKVNGKSVTIPADAFPFEPAAEGVQTADMLTTDLAHRIQHLHEQTGLSLEALLRGELPAGLKGTATDQSPGEQTT